MNEGRLVFTQVIDVLHREQLDRCIARYPMARSSRGFSARDQFLTMAFAQMTFRESLRDIEACLSSNNHLYAMGIRGNVTRTNLAYANENRSWRVYADLAQILIRKAQRLYQSDKHQLDLEGMIYALDSSTIDLCLSLFPWAHFRRNKAAIKLHTLMDLRGSIPVFISITEGSVHDVNVMDDIVYEPGSFYVMDRGYVDFSRLYSLHQSKAFYLTRAKRNMSFYVRKSFPVDKSEGLKSDQLIVLKTAKSKEAYPEKIRKVRYVDPETGKALVFFTNNFELPAMSIAMLYKSRWQIELFFKWIKQNLRIKSFYGTSENAVKTQIWIAICVYLMVACLNKIHGFNDNLSRMLQVFSVNVFQKEPVNQLLKTHTTEITTDQLHNQLMFNGL